MGAIKQRLHEIANLIQDLLDSGIEDYEIDEYLENQLTPEDFEFYHAHKDIIFDMLGYMNESLDEDYIIPSIFEGCCPGRKRRPKPTIITRPTPKPPVKKLHEKFVEHSDPVEDLRISNLRKAYDNISSGDVFRIKINDLEKRFGEKYRKGNLIKVLEVRHLNNNENILIYKYSILDKNYNHIGSIFDYYWEWPFDFFEKYLEPVRKK